MTWTRPQQRRASRDSRPRDKGDTMKRRTGILVCTLAAGMAWAQSPQVIQNTRTTMNTVRNNATAASNEALGINQTAPSKDAHAAAKPAATTVKSGPAVVKTSAAKPKATVVPAKANAASGKPSVVPASATSTSAAPATPKSAKTATKIAVKPVAHVATKKAAKPAAEKKPAAAAPKTGAPAAAASPSADAGSASSSDETKSDDDSKDTQDKKWSMSGKRDPFISPVVSHSGGSGCSTGKKCLEIGAINLRGVVHSDAGFIAVVTNSLNKAYFLRENDPVFDGYVVKITGDSVIFKETMQDRLGKTFTREVVKKLMTPAV